MVKRNIIQTGHGGAHLDLSTWRLKQENCVQYETNLGYSTKQTNNQTNQQKMWLTTASLQTALDLN